MQPCGVTYPPISSVNRPYFECESALIYRAPRETGLFRGAQVVGLNADPTATFHRLYDLDPATGSFTAVSGARLFPFDDVDEYACGPPGSGSLFTVGTFYRESNALYISSYNLSTAALVSRAPLNTSAGRQDQAFGVTALTHYSGRLYGVVFEGEMGWLRGVYSIDPATGAMNAISGPVIPADAVLWEDGCADHTTGTLYLFYDLPPSTGSGDGTTMLIAVPLAGGRSGAAPVKIPVAAALAQPVYFAGALFGWVGDSNVGPKHGKAGAARGNQLMKLTVADGKATALHRVTVPGYMAANALGLSRTPSVFRVSGSTDGRRKDAYLGTIELDQSGDAGNVSTVPIAEPMWFLCAL